jgi:hypothetical protein
MDPDAIENTLSHEKDTSAGPNVVTHDDKTDELVNQLESNVDKAYTSIQGTTLSGLTKIQGLVSEKLPEIQKQWKEVKLPHLPDVKVNELTKNLKLEEYMKPEDIEALKQRSTEIMTKAGENTNKVLDDLDNDLEKLENLTINYATQIGSQIGTFFKTQLDANVNSPENKKKEDSASSASAWNWSGWSKQLSSLVVGDSPETVVANEKKTELLFSLPKGVSPGTRAESQVHELQSDPSVYVKAVESGEFKDFKLSDEQKAEIKELLGNNSLHLMNVYKKVVGSIADAEAKGEATGSEILQEDKQISDDEFWKVYFGKQEQIMSDEQKRRALLEKSTAAGEEEEEEEFNWDDE